MKLSALQKRSCPACRFVLAIFLGPLISPLSAQVDGALVVRHGILVQGTVEGTVVALDDAAEIKIDKAASVIGDVVLPEEKGVGPNKAPQGTPSSKAKFTALDAGALRGKQRVASGFNLPKVAPPKKGAGTEVVVLATEKGDAPDFANTKDVTVNHPKRELAIPPGVYGDLSVQNGSVILGEKGSPVPTRYSFQSITIHSSAKLDLAGPVIVTVAALGKIQGVLGSTVYSNWLDLRVTSGPVAIDGKGEVYGVVTATESAVTVGHGTKLRGGLICDQATVESGGKFTGVQPSWSKESSGNSLPHFIHKAARVESKMPELVERYAADYAVSTTYAADEPALVLAKKRRIGPPDKSKSAQAFFDACCTVFDGSGFARASIVSIDQGLSARGRPDVNVVTLEREQFEDNLWAIGRKKQARDNIVLIRDDPKLLQSFMERALKLAADAAAKAAKEAGR